MSSILRCFNAMVLLGVVSLATPGTNAQMVQSSFPISSASVASALEAPGLVITASEVRLPTGLTARSATPSLHATGADLASGASIRVRLACRVGECLPFLILVSFSGKEAASNALSIFNSSSHPDLPIRPSVAPVLRAGEQTVLLMQDAQMRISLPVVSIDTGAVGSEIRVSTLDHRKVYRGIVLSSQAVQGDLQ